MCCQSGTEIWWPCGALRKFVLDVCLGLPLSIWGGMARCRLSVGIHRLVSLCRKLWATESEEGEEKLPVGLRFLSGGAPPLYVTEKLRP